MPLRYSSIASSLWPEMYVVHKKINLVVSLKIVHIIKYHNLELVEGYDANISG